MRYLFFSLLVFMALSSIKANDRELFNYSKTKVESTLNDLTTIEKTVNEHPGLNAEDLIKNGTIEDGSLTDFNSPISINGEPPLGIPSFFWGCIFGVAGMIVVVIMTDKDKAELTKAFYGCLTAYISFAVIYTFIIIESGGL